MDAVLDALERACATGLIPAHGPILLAVSGGADSTALLFGAVEAEARTGWRIAVGHVHHGWRGRDADRDLAFVADHARRLSLPFFSRRCDVRQIASDLRLSPEAAARHARYGALAEMASEAGAERIATAHQRDDAVESHLLAHARGGGLARLAGPRERRDDGVVRPLLAVTRAEILGFLEERGIAFRRDATNGDLSLSRNRVRRELSRVPEPERDAIALAVDVLARARASLDAEYARRIEPAVAREEDATTVDARVLAACPEELQRAALSRLASPYARAGRPPMTGPERERILALLASGRDFRFEAGRRIRLERRGDRLRIRLRDGDGSRPVYDAGARTSAQ